jgi:beta-lactamase class A
MGKERKRMTYKVGNKSVIIPDEIIENYMKNLDLTKQEAIDLYLDEEGITQNEEQNALDNAAKKVRIDHGVLGPKEKKPRTVKISDEKQALFELIKTAIESRDDYVCDVINNNKLLSVTIGDKNFKVNVSETRVKKDNK